MSDTKPKHTSGTVLVEDCTVYVLNEQGYNRWSCSVQAGGADSASPEEKRQIALKIQRCLNSHDKLVDALEGAQEELSLLRAKDTATVYDPTLRARIRLALADAKEKP